MIRYTSTKGGVPPVTFDEAILQGFAEDGGLFVPEAIPKITDAQLQQWSTLDYPSLAYEMISLFIDPQIIPAKELKQLIHDSFSTFQHPDLMPLVTLGNDPLFSIMELFHGPTLSFKDIAMGFLVRTMDYLLQKREQRVNLILATTGDTGPAAASAAAGRKTIDCWPLFPAGMISEEQERQMTTLKDANIHSVAVEDCPDGGDDLDIVVARMFADHERKNALKLSSVNSINWCRVMVQAVHYAYGYFRACKEIGAPVIFSVPSGAFGNLCAGDLARKMGIPISTFICANNQNQTLHSTFSTGLFKKKALIQTVSSAIDIVVPYNFWRFLYFNTNYNSSKISRMMADFDEKGEVQLDAKTHETICNGFESMTVSDEATLSTIKKTFEDFNYLLDPHGAVAVTAAHSLRSRFDKDTPIVCLATAHPAKFPMISGKALESEEALPPQALHPSLEAAKSLPERKLTTKCLNLENFLCQQIKDTSTP